MAQDQTAAANGPAGQPQPPLVAFDFDGTLTTQDSFTTFLKWRAGPKGYARGLLRMTPSLLAYVFHRDRGRLKAAAVREFLRGVSRETLEAEARSFAELKGRSLLRPDALAAWRRWRSDGARVVIVTASPDLLVSPFARALGADLLIGTPLAFDDHDRVRGAFSGPNCRGAEKVTRLRAQFGDDVRLQAAYGDTAGDREMLAIADLAGYRVFKGKP